METARYSLALLALLVYPSMLAFWLLIHPFTRFWRRAGLTLSYGVPLALMACLSWNLYRLRGVLLSRDYGANTFLMVCAMILFLSGITMEVLCRKHLSLSVLIGLPQLSPSRQGKLLKEGIYGRVRHPRYAGAALGLLALTLFTNYLATWILSALAIPALYWITELEDRELRERFGEEFEQYRNRVPRFLPRRTR